MIFVFWLWLFAGLYSRFIEVHLVNWLRHVTDPKKDENNQKDYAKDYAKDYVKDYEEMKLHLVLNTS